MMLESQERCSGTTWDCQDARVTLIRSVGVPGTVPCALARWIPSMKIHPCKGMRKGKLGGRGKL
eukprot:1523042-Pyramimonas_sp.AAC.1